MLERLMLWTATSTLVNAINSGATTLEVAAPELFPTDGNFRLRLGNELMLVTGVAGAVFTVERAKEGTTATSHNAGIAVLGVLSLESLLIATARMAYQLPLRLDFTSETVLTLTTSGGRLAVNPLTGEWKDCVGDIGTISNAELDDSTVYYAYYDIGADEIEVSSTDLPEITDGVDHKDSDPTKLLVGWFMVDADGLFAFDETRALVCSRHQQRAKNLYVVPNVGVWDADDLWHTTSTGTTPTAELWYLQSPRLGMSSLSFSGMVRHSGGGAHVFAGLGFTTSPTAGQPANPDTAKDVQASHKVDSTTERVALSRLIFDEPQSLGQSVAVLRRAALFIKGELVGSSAQVQLHSDDAPNVYGPWLSAAVQY
jgi:hypothetical protein